MEVSLDVTIRVDARNEQVAREILEDIRIILDDSSPKSYLSFTTDFRRRWRDNVDLDINYVINAPEPNSLDIINRHGEVYLGNRTGDVRIDLKHGRIRAGNLMGETELELAFGSGSVGHMKKGIVDVQHYNRITFDQMGDVELDNAHSNIRVGKAGKIYLEHRHGDMEFESVEELDGDVAHSDLEIRKVGKVLLLKIQHSDIDINEVATDFSRIEIDGGFSDVSFGLSPKSSFYLDAEFSFGSFKFDRSAFDVPYIQKESHNSRYKGDVNGADSNAKVYLNMQHGSVRLMDLY
jgi:hypothetical protein